MSQMFSISKQIDAPPRTPSHSVSVTTIRPREVRDIALKLSNNKLQLLHTANGDLDGEGGDPAGRGSNSDPKDCDSSSNPTQKRVSQWPLSIVRVESNSSPCVDFMMASASKLGDLKDENAPMTNKEFLDLEVAKLKGTKVQEKELLDVTVAIIWKAVVERKGLMAVVMGQHQVSSDPF